MFGHLLPPSMNPYPRKRSADDARGVLVQVLREMDPTTRLLMLHGLLRPDSVLVSGYAAPGHRSCPLASAVWEASGQEPTSFEAVQVGIDRLGLRWSQDRFVGTFDRWAYASGFVTADRDGTLVLTGDGRAELIKIVERLA